MGSRVTASAVLSVPQPVAAGGRRRSIVSVFAMIAAGVRATIIRVPADQQTIQTGINLAVTDDTILVYPGTYLENIDFYGERIVVGSLFLTTGDTSYISQTIIDGNAVRSVVNFTLGEDSATIITGFTIQNGLNARGGGIRCSYSSPTITHNRIVSNRLDARTEVGAGAGIYCLYSQPKIINNEILNNSYLGPLHNYAGGIYCEYSEPLIKDNRIEANSSQNVGGGICLLSSSGVVEGNRISGNYARYGGAISCGANSAPLISNNVIYGNDGIAVDGVDIFDGASPVIVNNVIVDNGDLGLYWDESDPVITNTIVWGNLMIGEAAASVTYCDIQGGYEGIGNIDQDPLFRDPSAGDFHLTATACGDLYDSPGIDAGHPDYSDRTLSCQWGHGAIRADLGAFGGNAGPVTAVDNQQSIVPIAFALMPNYPNPFNPSTTIEYRLPARTPVEIDIFNALGQKVRTLVDKSQPAGRHTVVWEGRDAGGDVVSTGIYFYRLRAGDRVEVRKMTLLK